MEENMIKRILHEDAEQEQEPVTQTEEAFNLYRGIMADTARSVARKIKRGEDPERLISVMVGLYEEYEEWKGADDETEY